MKETESPLLHPLHTSLEAAHTVEVGWVRDRGPRAGGGDGGGGGAGRAVGYFR